MRGRKLRVFTAIALVVVLLAALLGIYTLAFGSDPPPTVLYDHNVRSFVFKNVAPYEGNMYPNLFAEQDFIGMMPGDVVGEEIVISADGMDDGYAEIYLYAESVNEDISPEEAAAFDLLMENAAVQISWQGKDGYVYSDELEAEGSRVHLGTFHDGDELTVQVDFGIDIEAGNELQFIRAEIGWVFVAEVFEKFDPGIPNWPDPPALEIGEHYAYIIGREDGLVHPEANITRAEVATIFFRMLAEESRELYWCQTNPYEDIYGHEWHNNAVSTLTNAGILDGYPDGMFHPNDSITRAELAAIATRFYREEEQSMGSAPFADVGSHWAEDEIDLAYTMGLIDGYPDGTFRPDAYITHAETMAIVNRLLGRRPHKDHLPEEGMIEWPDNMDRSRWYYADVQEATNSHTYSRVASEADNYYEIWRALEPVRDWEALEKEWSEHNSSANPGEVTFSKHKPIFR